MRTQICCCVCLVGCIIVLCIAWLNKNERVHLRHVADVYLKVDINKRVKIFRPLVFRAVLH